MPRKNIPVPVPPGSKFCHACQTVHPVSAFNRNRSQSDGLCSQCRVCAKATAKKSREIQKIIADGLAAIDERLANSTFEYEFPVEPMSVPNP
jgi:hypothetical protein